MPARKFLTEKIQKLKIAVLGDVMLDRYFQGEVKRISPEAPVPVAKINKIKSVLGGAANVAANLAKLECQVYMGGIVGEDENRNLLLEIMAQHGINSDGLIADANRETISKLRILGGHQQMLRVDFEDTSPINSDNEEHLIQWLNQLLEAGIDGVIISDYAKGVCTESLCQWVIGACHSYNVPVMVDPKGNNWYKYTGCDYITPNLKELGEIAGAVCDNDNEAIIALANPIRQKYEIKNMIVTRSECGITVINSAEVFHNPATAREVFDVSGAGDTVVATLMAALGGKLSLPIAIYLANRAAGIVVGKVGTYPISRNELLRDIVGDASKNHGYALSWEEARSLVATWRSCGDTIVFTNGCFDLLHVGHVTYLEKARALGDHLILGLNTDASVRRLKGETRPLVHELDRARVLSALGCIDGVVLFDQDTPTELIKELQPDILVKGGDYRPDQVAGREYAGRVEIIDFEDGYSTTGVVEKIVAMVKEGKL